MFRVSVVNVVLLLVALHGSSADVRRNFSRAFLIRRRHLLAYIGIAILFLLIGVLVGNLHGWHECRWFYGVGTLFASHNIRRLEMPPSCGACVARSGVCEGNHGGILCHAHLWRHFSRAADVV